LENKMSAIILDGSMVHYEALGRGRPIVFLHGWVGSWRYWINAMQVASTSFRAYAIDLFGFGDTTRDPLRYSLERQADLAQPISSKKWVLARLPSSGTTLAHWSASHSLKRYAKRRPHDGDQLSHWNMTHSTPACGPPPPLNLPNG
jgi:pimeloyl-ACP methyl ester carboxylesterase